MKRIGAVVLAVTLLMGCAQEGGTSAPEKAPEAAEAAPVTSDTLYVERIEALPEGFLLGADVSSLLAEEASGVVYRNFAGEEQDMLKTLAEAGVNCVRVRVWVDPFDRDGRGYGGGSCTAETAAEIGKRAAQYGLKLLVDFHYSDFWADPGKQMAPKAWAGLSVAEKAARIETYTAESLEAIRAAGADIALVQIGNETNNGLCGETDFSDVLALYRAGARAVRAFDPGIRIVVHYTEPSPWHADAAQDLIRGGVDYDVFATSYYPFWHGTLENLQASLAAVAERTGKEVMVVETQWPYTDGDGDGNGNSAGPGSGYESIYPFTVKGQSREIRDVAAAVAAVQGGIGMFYWEAGWIPVPGDSREARSALWERYGSGWASSYAGEYDPDDAGRYYGGSACDNMALFDFEGDPLESLKTFALLRTGNPVPPVADALDAVSVTMRVGEAVALPEAVPVIFTDGSRADRAVVWNEEEVRAVRADAPGEYSIHGRAEGFEALCSLRVAESNYLANPSFEEEDRSMWTIRSLTGRDQGDFQRKAQDAHSGDMALHFWDNAPLGFTCEQTVAGLPRGQWRISVQAQGDDVGPDADIHLYVIADGKTYTAPLTLRGWANWQEAVVQGVPCDSGTVTVGVSVQCRAGGWGTFDDFLLTPEP